MRATTPRPQIKPSGAFRRHCLLLLLLAVCCASAALSQSALFKIPIVVTDSSAGKSETVWFGLSPDTNVTGCATSTPIFFGACDEDTMGFLPPFPPAGIYDVRFYDLAYGPNPGSPGNCLDLGVAKMYHPSVSTSQLDTFAITIQLVSTVDVLNVTWPAGLSKFCSSLTLEDGSGGLYFTQNMLTTTSFSNNFLLAHTPRSIKISTLYIIMSGPINTTDTSVAPVLSSPSTGSQNDSLNSLSLQWASIANALTYHVQVSADPAFAKILHDTVTTGTSIVLNGLSQGTKYYWQVRDSNAFTFSCYQKTPFDFTTILYPPATPVTIAPVSGAASVSPATKFSWNAIGNAASYEVEVSTDNFTTPIFDTSVTGTSVTYTGAAITDCGTYQWRVRSINATAKSPFTASSTFATLVVLPSVPPLVAPLDKATGQPGLPVLKWTGDPCSQTFTVQLATDSAFTGIVVNAASVAPDSLAVTTPLNGLTTYYWRVKATGAKGSSAYSPIRSFTTAFLPPFVPVLVSPGEDDVIVSQQATLIWNTSGNSPQTYHLQLDVDSTYPHPMVDTITADTTYNTAPLPFCQKYFWRISASNAAGASAFSLATRAFLAATVVPAPPILLGPPDTAKGVPFVAVLHWRPADPCTQRFRVQVSNDSLFGAPGIVLDSTLALDSITVGPLGSQIEYFWRVAALGIRGSSPPDSARHRFTTTALVPPDSVVLASPPNGAGGLPLTVTLAWDSSARARNYHLFVAYDSLFTERAFEDSTLTKLSQAVGPLPNSTQFYWKVRASNTVGIGKTSAVWSFATLAPPSAPVPIQPVNGTKIDPTQWTFTWTIPDRADSTYELQVALDSGFVHIIHDDTTLRVSSNVIVFTPELNGRLTYYWRVRGKNFSGTGPFSSVASFVTLPYGFVNWMIPLAVAETGPARDTVYFGVDERDANNGISPVIGAFELPPPVSGMFDARFVSIPSEPGILGNGVRLAADKFSAWAQIDTFKVAFQPGVGTYPMRLSWTSRFIRAVCDSAVIMDAITGTLLHARMDMSNSIVDSNTNITSMIIIKYGVYPVDIDTIPIDTITGVRKVSGAQIPKGYELSQNYPNPFNPTTNLRFSTEHAAQISLAVYDVLGREVTVLARGAYAPGVYEVTWSGRSAAGLAVPSGVYYARIMITPNDQSNGQFTTVRKMLMLK